jgi:hypothetical protein
VFWQEDAHSRAAMSVTGQQYCVVTSATAAAAAVNYVGWG